MEGSTNNQTPPDKHTLPIGWVIAVLLVVVAWAGAYALRGGGTKEVMAGWADGMPAGQELAQETGKPMVVLFTAGWCGPCQQLKKNVLTDQQVDAQLRARFVPVQIDLTDRSANNPNVEVAQKYGVQSIPTLFAMSPEGDIIEMYRGGNDISAFQSWLNNLPTNNTSASLR